MKQCAYPGTGGEYWLVSCTLPSGKRHRKKCAGEQAAVREKNRLLREHSGGSVGVADLATVERVVARLKDSGVNRDIVFAVDWFLEHYRDFAHAKTLAEYKDDFIEAKRREGKEARTIKEYEYHLDDFSASFGEQKPHEVTHVQIENYLSSRSCLFHRHKCVKALFAFLCNQGRTKLEHPPLEESPFRFLSSPTQTRKNGRPLIATVEEVKKLIEKALEEKCAPWFVWGFFTGMRPEAEMLPFWKDENYGWKCVDLENRKIVVDDTLEKVGTRTREIEIRPNLMEWIKLFKADPERYPMLPKNLVKQFRTVKYAVLDPRKARENDLLRHNFISGLYKTLPSIDQVAVQCATSKEKILKHYLVLMTNAQAKAFFDIRPRDFGLKVSRKAKTLAPRQKGEKKKPEQTHS